MVELKTPARAADLYKKASDVADVSPVVIHSREKLNTFLKVNALTGCNNRRKQVGFLTVIVYKTKLHYVHPRQHFTELLNFRKMFNFDHTVKPENGACNFLCHYKNKVFYIYI